MNRLKSLFLIVFMTGASLMLGHSVTELVDEGMVTVWIGAAIASFAVVAFFAYLMVAGLVLRKPWTPRTSRRVWPVVVTTGFGAVISIGGFVTEGGVIVAPLYAMFSWLGWLAYELWYSTFGKRDTVTLVTGGRLPTFEVQDENGDIVMSDDFAGSKALILFYRGNWCPLCMAQIQEVAVAYRQLEARGVAVYLISPQPHENTKRLAGRFDVNMHFLVDPGNAAARKLGLLHENGLPSGLQVMGYDSDTVMPTAVITDETGRIIFTDLTDNYRVRPEPETFLKIIDGYGGANRAVAVTQVR